LSPVINQPHPLLLIDKHHQKRLDVLNRVQRQYLESKGPEVVYGALLQGVLDLMNCEYGFIGEVKYETTTEPTPPTGQQQP
jgi:hypothetical protein